MSVGRRSGGSPACLIHDIQRRNVLGSPGGRVTPTGRFARRPPSLRVRPVTATAAPAETSTAPERGGLVLVALILVAAVANLNLAVANVALPDIGKDFDAG